jgi:hypothetical protein
MIKDSPGDLSFRRELIAILHGPTRRQPDGWKRIARAWSSAFLAAGSETPDNLSCTENVDYGALSHAFYETKGLQGLRVKGSRIPLAALSHALEDIEMPGEIAQRFPDLTQEHWDAFLRVVTMTLVMFEHPIRRARRVKKPSLRSK